LTVVRVKPETYRFAVKLHATMPRRQMVIVT